jgi:hypothetical protein
MTDSLYERGCALRGAPVAPLAQALTATPTKFPALFTSVINSHPSNFTVDLVNANITLLSAGFYHEFSIGMIVDGPVNIAVSASLYKNNIAVSGLIGVETTGAGETKSMQIIIPQIGVASGDIYDVRMSSVPPSTITFTSLNLLARLAPTTTPI